MAAAGDRLVGRREELAFLRTRLADAREGSGRIVLVCGPAGIGKTCLVEELLTFREGMEVGWGAALADAGMPPLWPWSRALRTFPEAGAALAPLIAGDNRGEYGSADDAAAATFTADMAVLDALEAHAAEEGMLLVLDDLQWADGATFRLLGRLAAAIRRFRLLVLATHRDPGHVALAGLLGQAGTEVLRLRPLTHDESEAFIAAAVHGADPAAIRQAVARSGGSPLFLRTLAQVASEQLRGHVPWTDTLEAPEFRHLVSAALRTSGPDAAAAVEAASVLGEETQSWLVAHLLGLESGYDVMTRLRPAVPAGLVEVRSGTDNDVCFAHGLVRDTVYAGLAREKRARLHRRAAEWLEPLAVGHDERAGAVATHWVKAEKPDRAVEWAVRAADAARAAASYDESAAYLSLALDATEPSPGRERHGEIDRAELFLDLGRCQYLGGRLDDSLESCERAADEGERTGRPDVVARAAIIIQGVGHPVVNERLVLLCRRALAVFPSDAPEHLRARVEAQLACALFETAEHDEADRWSLAALRDAATSGDTNAELDAIRARATLTQAPGDDEEILELGRRAIELAKPTGRPLARLLAHVWRSDAAIHLVNLADAWKDANQIKELADRTALPLARWHWFRRNATLCGLTGDFEGCRRAAAEAATIAEGWHDISVYGTHVGLLVSLALLRGDVDDVPSEWGSIVDESNKSAPIARSVLAAVAMLAGRHGQADAIYRPMLRTLDELSGLTLAALPYLSDVASALDDPAGCQLLREKVSATFGKTLAAGAGTVWFQGSIARWLGELDVGCHDWEAAIRHLDAGIAVDRALDAQPYVARGQLAMARAFRATGDLARSVELTRTALAAARRLDMPGVVRGAELQLAEIGAGRAEGDPLTVREREVAQLVARALSNKEVADTLFLSERTVESHVRNILAKTGLKSRTELTRWVLQGRHQAAE